MERSMIKGYIASRVAKELNDGDVVNLGIGLPTLVPGYLPENVQVILQSENGIIGTGTVTEDNMDPVYVVDAGGRPAAVKAGGSYIDSTVSFGLIRGGHVDVTVLGALEVDQQGNLSNWIIPGKKVPGMGGAMDLVVGAKKVIVAMEHTARGNAKILKECRLPYTALHCVDMIVTEMCVMEVTQDGLIMTELNPEFTVEDVKAATEADFIVSDELREMNAL
ncbi:MAG: 3-oxoacid CoA-transferase subunit B [Lachnospiraceae bacterium]